MIDNPLLYCPDPFGNIIELFSHPDEQTFANWPTAPDAGEGKS